MWNDLSHGLSKIFTHVRVRGRKIFPCGSMVDLWLSLVTSVRKLLACNPRLRSALLEEFCWCSELPFYSSWLFRASRQLGEPPASLTVCLQLVCHLVDFTLKSSISGKFVHHADRSLLLLHLLDFGSHLALLLGIFLYHLRELKGDTADQTRYQQRQGYSCRGADGRKWFDVAEFRVVPTKRVNI